MRAITGALSVLLISLALATHLNSAAEAEETWSPPVTHETTVDPGKEQRP